jgi:hypothetical protein
VGLATLATVVIRMASPKPLPRKGLATLAILAILTVCLLWNVGIFLQPEKTTITYILSKSNGHSGQSRAQQGIAGGHRGQPGGQSGQTI